MTTREEAANPVDFDAGYQAAIRDIQALAPQSPDDIYFGAIKRQREHNAMVRERRESSVRRVVAEEITKVLDEFLPASVEYDRDLMIDEQDLEERVICSEAQKRVEERIANALASGGMEVPHFVRNQWYKEEIEALTEASWARSSV